MKKSPRNVVQLPATLNIFWDALESRHSRRAYVDAWARYVEWLIEAELAPLTAKAADIQRYITELRSAGKAKATRAKTLSIIRSTYDALVVAGLLQFNPARSVKNVRVDNTKPKTPWMAPEALRKLLATANDVSTGADEWRARRDRLCLLLCVGLGWRRSEIARMRVEDFHDGLVEGVVKGGKKVEVGVPAWLGHEIMAWCAYAAIAEGALLPRWPGDERPISDSLVYEIVKAAAERAGLPADKVTPHGLRRTFITTLLGRGVGLKDLQDAVAHSSSKTTELYAKERSLSAPGQGLADLVYGDEDEGDKDEEKE